MCVCVCAFLGGDEEVMVLGGGDVFWLMLRARRPGGSYTLTKGLLEADTLQERLPSRTGTGRSTLC